MVWTSALQVPPRSQFDASSGSLDYSAKYNCGVTVATEIGQFLKDKPWLGIEATRTGAGVARGRPTTYDEQRRMFIYRGVGASVRVIDSLASLRALVRGGKRPVSIGVLMSRVPAWIRGHSFTGWHSLEVLDAPAGGFWVNESNLPVGSTGFRRWYPDATMQYAFIDAPGYAIAVVPYDAKVVTAPAPAPTGFPMRGWVNAGVNARYLPTATAVGAVHHLTTIGGNYTFIGSADGPPPPGSGSTSRRWLVYRVGTTTLRLCFHSSVVRF